MSIVTILGKDMGVYVNTGTLTIPAVSVGNPAGIAVGQTVTGTGITAATTVLAVSGNQLSLSANATVANGTALSFSYAAVTGATAAAAGVNVIVLSVPGGIGIGSALSGTGIAANTVAVAVNGTSITLSQVTSAIVLEMEHDQFENGYDRYHRIQDYRMNLPAPVAPVYVPVLIPTITNATFIGDLVAVLIPTITNFTAVAA